MKNYFKKIVFVISPLHGSHRFSEDVQMYPCDYPNAPKSEFATRFPCVLEYSLSNAGLEHPAPATAEDLRRTERQIDRANGLIHLLSAVTNHHFFKDDEIVGAGVWGIPKDAPEDTDEAFRSVWVEELYMWPEIAEDLWPARNFEKPAYKLSALRPPYAPVVPASIPGQGDHYYFDGGHRDYPDQVVFPDCASAVLQAYESLDTATQRTIDAITQLIDNGLALMGRMKSLSFLSFVAAIEALVVLENPGKPESCKECGQPKYKVTKKFVDFLSSYVDGSRSSKKIFSEIYNSRSQIAHTGALLLGDAHEHWEQKEDQEKQLRLHKMAAQFARVSLVNWLLAHSQQEQVG